MEIQIAPRRTGKTNLLVHRSANTGEVIITHSSSIKHIKKYAEEQNLTIPEPQTYQDFMKDKVKDQGKGVIIINFDLFLSTQFIGKVNLVTLTASIETI